MSCNPDQALTIPTFVTGGQNEQRVSTIKHLGGPVLRRMRLVQTQKWFYSV
jgi:hypothetical protein